jgi:putative membrane protein
LIRTDGSFSDTIAHAVTEAERGTIAEIVVVVAARSGSYLDVALVAGAVVASLALAIALFAPVTFHPLAVAIEIPLVLSVVAWLVHRTPAVLGRLLPTDRAKHQVERAAAAHFVAEAVHGTKRRTGLLLYVSLLEGRVTIVSDFGLQALVPAATWATVRFGDRAGGERVRDAGGLVEGIGAIGAILRERAAGDDRDGNEFPDAPRILP